MLAIMLNKVAGAGISHIKNTLVDSATPKSVPDLPTIAEAKSVEEFRACLFYGKKWSIIISLYNFCLVCGIDKLIHHYLIAHKLIISAGMKNEVILIDSRNKFMMHYLI
jgi:hypothetical protein